MVNLLMIYTLPFFLFQYSIAKFTSPLVDFFSAAPFRPEIQIDPTARTRSQEIRRAVSALSYPPNLKVRENFFPSLLQDAAASCFWKENNGRLVPESVMNELGVPLLAHICTSASQCKNQCLEMHEDSDIEVCNYITWYEHSNTALFYSLEPTKHWHLQSVPNVKSYEWRCIPNSCSWYWRPEQTIKSIESCSRCVPLTTTFCRDFGHCQRQCETMPSCNHFYMSNNGTEGYGRMYHVAEQMFDEKYYEHSDRRDSFEMRCEEEGKLRQGLSWEAKDEQTEERDE
uniref:Uncharacterized protein n=1 Tax=Trichuris muris TaxID=70415 RepID=A0A5S6QSZ6_TRIMR